MPIDFHAENNRFTYTTREADPTWRNKIKELVEVRGKKIADIACGGGIYSKAFLELGAAEVTGVDFSEEMLKGAKENTQGLDAVHFVIGNALDTGLGHEQFDVILERALIHHLPSNQLEACFAEAMRLLRPGGVLLVQDRTPEDCLLPGSETHIRGYFFSRYPKLVEKEVSRRHEGKVVQTVLQQAGFTTVEEHTCWETRLVYDNLQELEQDLLARTGRSLLHDLTDAELQDLVTVIKEQIQQQGTDARITEQDRWTIWKAQKGWHA